MIFFDTAKDWEDVHAMQAFVTDETRDELNEKIAAIRAKESAIRSAFNAQQRAIIMPAIYRSMTITNP